MYLFLASSRDLASVLLVALIACEVDNPIVGVVVAVSVVGPNVIAPVVTLMHSYSLLVVSLTDVPPPLALDVALVLTRIVNVFIPASITV